MIAFLSSNDLCSLPKKYINLIVTYKTYYEL